jgi:hypothetical protein
MKLKLIATTTALLLASASQAAVTTYTSQSGFAAALGTLSTEDFNDATLVPGLSFTSTVGNIGGGLFNDRLVIGSAETTFSFAGGANGFGAIFDMNPGGLGQGISFTLNLVGGGTEVAGSLLTSTVGFFGFTSTNAFTSVTLRGDAGCCAETYNLDNLQFGSAVPEPGTWMLMVVGFGLVGAGLRKRSTVVAA